MNTLLNTTLLEPNPARHASFQTLPDSLNTTTTTTTTTTITTNITTNITTTNSSENSSADLFSRLNLLLWQTVPPALLVLGCFGNGMTVAVMSRRTRAAPSTACLSVYFTALAVSDLLLLLSSLLWYWPPLVFRVPLSFFHDVSCTVLFYVFYVTSLTSAWFLVAMTCQRMTSVVVPHRVRVLCTVRRGRALSAAIGVLACVANVHIFFNYQAEYYPESENGACVSKDERAANVFRVIDLGLASVIPFLCLAVSNGVLVTKALQSRRLSSTMTGVGEENVHHHHDHHDHDHDHRYHQSKRRLANVSSMTITLVLTSAAFLLLTLPTCVLDVYLEVVGFYARDIADDTLNALLSLVDTAFLLMWIGNSAVNFYIYVLSGSKFRGEVKRLLVRSPGCVRT